MTPLPRQSSGRDWRRCSSTCCVWLCGSLLLPGILVSFFFFSKNAHITPNNEIPRLNFGQDGSFKILQLADLHIGEAEDTEWGPEQDRKTWVALDSIIGAENPDLIVLSGDQLTANNVDANASAYYHMLGEKLSKYNHPWALIFGNHDDAPLERVHTLSNGTTKIDYLPAKTSRAALLQIDQSFPLSMTKTAKGSDLFGTSNYALPLAYHDKEVAQILFLDSGGGSLPQRFEQNQIDWLMEQTSSGVPTVVFAHIPTQQFMYRKDTCSAGLHADGVAPVEKDAGLVQALVDTMSVHFLASGHNHGNDYCCKLSDMLHICFGRHSGYGGYGTWDRGSRVYELLFENLGTAFSWRSWVRMEDGTVEDEYEPVY